MKFVLILRKSEQTLFYIRVTRSFAFKGVRNITVAVFAPFNGEFRMALIHVSGFIVWKRGSGGKKRNFNAITVNNSSIISTVKLSFSI